MRSEEIRVGAAYALKVGRNTVRVTVTEAAGNGGWTVETHTGRTMAVRSADRFVGPADAPAAAETPPPAAETPQAEPSPTPATERDSGEQGAPTGEAGGTMSLLDAAVHLLGQAEEPMQCKDLVERARAAGLWAPRRGGRTPDRTLYSAILREINTKGDASRFRRAERGRFALNR
ncbi:MAG: hypothetical protein BWZ02_02998 [Lentisphaerae bacterium ADurb.BinA184]|nr:MAG: hypothetical protein BWZ02_02998 [Lentisphaerae bacterium ADurb.BinA184]